MERCILPRANPTIIGAGGWKAWDVPVSDVPDKAGVACWFVYCPGAHAAWDRWLMSCVHLRELPGDAHPAHKKFPEATHEIIFCALDPDSYGDHAEIPPKNGWRYLVSFDLVTQIQVPDDGSARTAVLQAVELVMSGRASPDSDFRRYWIEFFEKASLAARLVS